MENMHWSDLLFNLSISLLGGLVKSLTSKTKKKGFAHFLTSAIIGGFAGLLTYMLCTSIGLSWQMTSFATGVAGYMGDSILELFSEILPKFLTGKFNIQISDTEESKEDKKESGKKDNKSNKKESK